MQSAITFNIRHNFLAWVLGAVAFLLCSLIPLVGLVISAPAFLASIFISHYTWKLFSFDLDIMFIVLVSILSLAYYSAWTFIIFGKFGKTNEGMTVLLILAVIFFHVASFYFITTGMWFVK